MKKILMVLLFISSVLQAKELVTEDFTDVVSPGEKVTSNYAQEMLNELNMIREWYDCEKLVLYERLECAAVTHSNDIGENRICSGKGTDGSTMDSRADRCATVAFGQFVACGHTSAKAAVYSWTKDYSNRKFVLDPRLKKIGVGMHNNYWTVVFSY